MAMTRKMIYTAGLPLMILSLIFVCCAFALPWATAIYDKDSYYFAYAWYGGSYKYTYEYDWNDGDAEGSDSETFADSGEDGVSTASIISIASMAMLLIMYLVLSIVMCKNRSEEKVGPGVMKVFSVLLLVGSFALLVGVIIWILEISDFFENGDDMAWDSFEVSSCTSGCALGMTAAVVTFLYGIMLAGATCCMKEAGYDNSAPAGSTAVVVN